MVKQYREFDKSLTREDLNEEELECYKKLMKGINKTSKKEKNEVSHLMEVFIENDEDVHTNCIRCGEEFENDTEGVSRSAHLIDKRIYCNKCLKKMWSPLK